MNTRKQLPWPVLYAVLGIMLAGSYFVAGLFTLPDVTVFNYGQKLLYILLHPIHIWWNDKTLMVMGTACILTEAKEKIYQFQDKWFHGPDDFLEKAQIDGKRLTSIYDKICNIPDRDLQKSRRADL